MQGISQETGSIDKRQRPLAAVAFQESNFQIPTRAPPPENPLTIEPLMGVLMTLRVP